MPAEAAAGSSSSAGRSPTALGALAPAAASAVSHHSGTNRLHGHHRHGCGYRQEQLESCGGKRCFISLSFPATQCLFPHIKYGKTVSPARYFYRAGDTVSFVCHSGYTLRGSRTSTCQADFRWSPPLPVCKKGKCPSAARAVAWWGKAPSCVLSNSVGKPSQDVSALLASLLKPKCCQLGSQRDRNSSE